MLEPDWKNCTEEQLWKYVATHLAKNGISTVLVGGAVVAIYSEGGYRSGDLDFVLESFVDTKVPAVMKEISFEKSGGGRHYKHPECKHIYVEFATPPASIGDDSRVVPDEIISEGVKIKIFSPTDCIRDRLASYIYFQSMECLDQAVMVAKKLPFDLKKVEKWCKSENALEQYQDFIKKLKNG